MINPITIKKNKTCNKSFDDLQPFWIPLAPGQKYPKGLSASLVTKMLRQTIAGQTVVESKTKVKELSEVEKYLRSLKS